MNDLQDALKRRDTWWNDSNDHQRVKDRQLFVEAARRVANPDMDAATKAVQGRRRCGVLYVGDAQIARVAVDAALGITEDTK